MKKKFTFLLAAIAMLAVLAQPMKVWAQDPTASFTVTGLSSVPSSFTSSPTGFTMSVANNGGSNSPGLSSGSLRIYAKNQMTIASTNGTTKIKTVTLSMTIKASGSGKYPGISAPSGSFDPSSVTTSTSSITWTAAGDGVTTITFTFPQHSSGEGGNWTFSAVSLTYESGGGGLKDNDLALTGAPIELEFDLNGDADPLVIYYTTSSTGAVSIDDNDYATFDIDETGKTITVTPKKKTPSAQTITVNQDSDDDYNAGSKTFTVTITDSTPVSWVETSLNDLTSGDVFVIVGTNSNGSYAMTNSNGTSNPPAASGVTIEKVNNINKITSDVDDNIQWNLVITDGGYVFYPAGDASKWLYCTNNNNGVRVGTGDAKHFTIDSDYLYMTETNENRYIGIYNSQDWRCYTSINSNIENQTFAFYKKVYDNNSSYSTSITGCGTSTGNNVGYYLIASPVISVNPTTSNFLTNSYDLYYFDQSSEGSEWKNYKANSFNLYTGIGYLYANSYDVELTFTGQPYNGNGVVGLKYDNKNTPYFKGWNLIGNPYSTTAYLPKDYAFYKMKDDHYELEAVTNVPISAMEGVFVKVNAVNQTVTFSTTAPAKGWTAGSKVVINVADNKGNFIDRAIVRFDEGNTLPKFMLNDKNAKVYIPREDDDYAVVISDGKDNMSVNFKPATTGKYTLTIDTEGIDMNYLHLIDRFTGEDIDLLVDNTYSFVGSQIDNDSRFILSFTAKGYSVTSDEPFAYQSGTDIIVDGNGELQIFDVTGRKVMTTTINGVQTLNSLNTGFYIFRLNEKTQKIVVR